MPNLPQFVVVSLEILTLHIELKKGLIAYHKSNGITTWIKLDHGWNCQWHIDVNSHTWIDACVQNAITFHVQRYIYLM